MLITNKHALRGTYPAELQSLMNVERAEESRRWLYQWKEIAPAPTPLYELPDVAAGLGVARFSVKDESQRSPLGSFKALGAPVALLRWILRQLPGLDPAAVFAGRYADQLQGYTVISATDGNHGRALAAAARDAGCRCVIVLHAKVSLEREEAISRYGAQIVRIEGNYDESVAEAARLAAANGWQVISDTSYEDYEEIPLDVMQGYATIAAEIVAQAGVSPGQAGPYTHVFLQGGVGGIAAGVASYLWEYQGRHRPRFIVVEPVQADCLLQSAIHGRPAKATGTVDSVMAGLACGEASPLAWKFLAPAVDHFMTVEDGEAIEAMRVLAQGSERDMPIVAGESGVVGLAAMRALRRDAALAGQLGLEERSSVLMINTEGATAASVYQDLIGESAASVLHRQARRRAARDAADMPYGT
ncbi:diaminopropionate ammonia-lyase [Parapusillimonas granuli]|uniref:Diaminopropionate ammonia-lyase n=1 Tax=Parapusillimonas granuli TaxID=380911 RepID=A0A853G0W6_9BURK|nr:diaminopropionate ammonia-lyase [Parapusillimonas granuli]NYT49532.1 diaminopropionate ammonia-lyase [Parapusillimonas granuli]